MYRIRRLFRPIALTTLSWSAVFASHAQTPSRFSVVQTCISTQSPAAGCDIAADLKESLISPVTLNTIYRHASPEVRMTVNNVADAHYGFLRAGAEENFRIGNVPLYTSSYALANFQDQVTVSYGPWAGQRGYMRIQYTLNGNVRATPANTTSEGILVCGIQAAGSVNYSGEVDLAVGSINGSTSAAANGIFTFPNVFQFTYGQPFSLGCLLLTHAGSYDSQGDYAPVTGWGSAAADFGNTALISGLVFTDVSGNPIDLNPTITASSGTAYSTEGILTPFRDLQIDELQIGAQGTRARLESGFKIAEAGPGFDPLTQDVAVQIGAFSTVVPAGSFHGGAQHYEFRGESNGIKMHASIERLSRSSFNLEFDARGSNLGIASAGPQRIAVEAGLNGGSAVSITDSFED